MPPQFRSGNFSDPVHGYIRFTGLEREIIDHSATQRLRGVSQTGRGELVYPELRSSRFSHCLGAMHLSSSFLVACLKNCAPEERKDLVEAIWAAVETFLTINWDVSEEHREPPPIDLAESALQAYRWYDAENSGSATATSEEETPSVTQELRDEYRRRALALTEQSLRLASLFHDLGHLPFSHDFEFALAAMRNDSSLSPLVRNRISRLYQGLRESKVNKFHEVIGPELAHLILREVLGEHISEAPFNRYVQIFSFAYRIWRAQEPWNLKDDEDLEDEGTLALSWLKSLVSGQLDVDRADYILRDGRNYGFDFASYDLERLLGQLVVAKMDNGALALAVRSQGIAFLESFVLSRYRSYQFGVLHHKVSQIAAALQYSIAKTISDALEIYASSGPLGENGTEDDRRDAQAWAREVVQFLDDLEQLMVYRRDRDRPRGGGRRRASLTNDEAALLRRFAGYDDIWWTSLMRRRYGLETSDPWICLVLWRSPGPRSLWKRSSEFLSLLTAARQYQSDATDPLPSELRDWNAGLPGGSRSKELSASDQRALQNRWDDAVKDLRANKGVLVLRKQVVPLELDRRDQSVGLYVHTPTGVEHLTRLSPLTHALAEAWKDDLQLQAFVGEWLKSEKEFEELATQVITDLWQVMLHEKETGADNGRDDG